MAEPGAEDARPAVGRAHAPADRSPPGTHYFKVVAVMSTGGSRRGLGAVARRPSVTVGPAAARSVVMVIGQRRGQIPRLSRHRRRTGRPVYLETSTTVDDLYGCRREERIAEDSGKQVDLQEPPRAEERATRDHRRQLVREQLGGVSRTATRFSSRRKNQERKAPWTVVRDVVFSNNVLRHSAVGINISGYDWRSTPSRRSNIKIVNNVFEDISGRYGRQGGAFLLIRRSARHRGGSQHDPATRGRCWRSTGRR